MKLRLTKVQSQPTSAKMAVAWRAQSFQAIVLGVLWGLGFLGFGLYKVFTCFNRVFRGTQVCIEFRPYTPSG